VWRHSSESALNAKINDKTSQSVSTTDTSTSLQVIRIFGAGGCFLILFVLIEPLLLLPFTQIGEADYGSSWILYSALTHKRFSVAFMVAVMIACFYRRKPSGGPGAQDRGWRVLLSTAVVVLSFAYCLHDYNFYWGSWHLPDRISLLVLCVATLWSMAFMPLWLLQFVLIVGQFSHDPLYYSWTDKMPLIQICYLGAFFVPTWLILKPARKHLSGIFLAAALIMWGGFYLSAGLAKIPLDWLWLEPMQNLLIGAWLQNNWLGFMGEEAILMIASLIDRSDSLLRLFVIVTELGACAYLFHRNSCIIFLACILITHLGIFALTGISFWKWMAIDIAIIYIVLIKKPFDLNMRSGFVALGLMFLFIYISKRDIPLGWLDAPMAWRFEFRAVTDSGERIEVPPSRFEPYDMPFAQGRFYFTTKRKKLIDCMGAIQSKEAHQSIVTASGKDDITEVIEKYGSEQYASKRVGQLTEFLSKYSLYLKSGISPAYQLLGLPQHIWSFPDASHETAKGKQIVAWEIEHTEWLYNKGSIDEIYKQIYDIPLADETAR
jgi:hypothetical protein